MKKFNIFLALPIAASVVIPAASCSKPIKQVGIWLNSEKELDTKAGERSVVFAFGTEIQLIKENISWSISNETVPSSGTTKRVELDNEKNLYFIVTFNGTPDPGDFNSFDLTLNIFGKPNLFTGLKATYIEKNVPIPEDALIVSADGELQGINPTFTITDHYTSLKVPANVTSIAESAFESLFAKNKNHISKIVLNNKLTKIGASAFKGCNGIDTLDVSRVPYYSETCPIQIGVSAFAGWQDTGTIEYGSANRETYDALDFALCDRGLGLGWFKNSTTRTLPTSDLNIENSVLKGPVWDLDNYPKHVQMVDKIILPYGLNEIAANAFYDEENNKGRIPSNINTISFPKSLNSIGKQAFKYTKISQFMIGGQESETPDICVFPDSLTSIGEEAFYCVPIYGVVFDAELKTIGANAFAGTAIDRTPLAYINVEALNDIPAGWKNNGIFNNISEEGDIVCNPIYAKTWKEYFMSYGIDFSNQKWNITQYVDLLKPFTPSTQPITPTKTITQAEAIEEFKKAADNTSIFIDDLIYSLQESIDASVFSDFKVIIAYNGVQSGTVSFRVLYEATLKDTDIGYYGVWNITALTPDAASCKVSKRKVGETEILDFPFDLSNGGFQPIYSSLAISESKYEGEEETATFRKTYYSDDLPTTISEETVGGALCRMNWLRVTVDEQGNSHFILPINSHYLGKFELND